MKSIIQWIEPKKSLPADRQLFTNAALKTMIIPMVLEQLLQMVVGLADTMMVSYAGEAVVAGVGLDTMVYTIFIYLFTAISSGGAVVVSQYIGSRDRQKADLAASQIVHIAGLLSMVCMVLMLLFGSGLLSAMYPETEAATMYACQTYMRIVALSFPANAVYNAGAAIYRSMGQTKITMWVSLLANLTNVAGNAIGIFVFKAGAAGVAWPTTISWFVAAVIMTWLCADTRRQQQREEQDARLGEADAAGIFPVVHVGIPPFCETTIAPAISFVNDFLSKNDNEAMLTGKCLQNRFFTGRKGRAIILLISKTAMWQETESETITGKGAMG